jgi:hypothetical protein
MDENSRSELLVSLLPFLTEKDVKRSNGIDSRSTLHNAGAIGDSAF